MTPTLVWPNKERHEGFRAAPRKKRADHVALARRQAIVSEILSEAAMSMRSVTRRQTLAAACAATPLLAMPAPRRRGLSRASDPGGHSLRGRRRCRGDHAPAGGQHGAAARPEAGARGEARRRRQHRHPGGRARRARRLHDPGRRHQQLRHQPVRDEDVVRSDGDAGADREGRRRAAGAVLQSGRAGAHAGGVHRLRQGQSRQGQLRRARASARSIT